MSEDQLDAETIGELKAIATRERYRQERRERAERKRERGFEYVRNSAGGGVWMCPGCQTPNNCSFWGRCYYGRK